MRVITIVCGLMCLSLPALAQEVGSEILDLFDNFALANSVASHCERPNGSVRENFVPNFQRVTRSTAVYLKQLTPTITETALTKSMNERYLEIDKRVVEAIDKEGCDGPNVQDARRQFYDFAKVDMTAKRH